MKIRGEWAYIPEVPEETLRIGLLFGLMRKAQDEDVYEFTPKGAEWFDKWLDDQLAIARMMAL